MTMAKMNATMRMLKHHPKEQLEFRLPAHEHCRGQVSWPQLTHRHNSLSGHMVGARRRAGTAPLCPQVGEHSQNTAVVVLSRLQLKLHEDVADVRFDGLGTQVQAGADRRVGA